MFFVRTLIIWALSVLVCAPAFTSPVDTLVCNEIEVEKKARQCHAKTRGLPKNASWEAVSIFDGEINRTQAAKELGLPESSSWETITTALEEAEEKQLEEEEAAVTKAHTEMMAAWTDTMRKSRAHELGLPSTSTWKEISDKASDISRREYAIENGLSPTTSWEDIQKAVERKVTASYKAKGIEISPKLKKPSPKRKKINR